MPRRALVTGATGFVGSHLAERLVEDGWQTLALVRPTSDTARLRALGVRLVEGDLSSTEALRCASEGVEVVFHLAAVTAARDEGGYLHANAEGTRRVSEAVASAGARPRRVVYLSSYAACGPAEPGRPRTLADPPAPLTAYGRTKLAGEEQVRRLAASGVAVVVVRAPAVYGPGDRALLSYFRLVNRGLAPEPAGPPRRLHLVYAPDLARALVRAADVPPDTYPVAEPAEHAWAEVVAEMARALGRRPLRLPLPPALVRTAAAVTEGVGRVIGRAVPFNREKAEEMLARAWVCDLDGSATLLSRAEATPLAEGITRTVDWYRRQGWL